MNAEQFSQMCRDNPSEMPCSPRWLANQMTATLEQMWDRALTLEPGHYVEQWRAILRGALASRGVTV